MYIGEYEPLCHALQIWKVYAEFLGHFYFYLSLGSVFWGHI